MLVRNFVLSVFSLVAIVGFATPAQAQGIDSSGWIGGIFGIHIPDADDTSARPAFGITGGAKLGTEWGFGAYYLNSAKEETINRVKLGFDYTMYGVEGAYHFEGEAAGVYMGARLGMTNLEVGAVDGKPMHWGLLAGYNHWLTENLSLGGEATYFNVADSDDNGIPLESFSIIAFHATLKLWF